ncbi:MAG: ATP-binding cassette domain-containing protein [Crocinitomicaceae bacterium]
MKFELKQIIPYPLKTEKFEESSIWNQSVSFDSSNRILLNASSGRGKSTFINIIYGIRTDFEGELIIDDQKTRSFSIHNWVELRRERLSFIPQDLQLFPSMTALENLRIKNNLNDLYSETEMIEFLERVGLDHKINQICGTLSMGQQQRIAIIRALLQPYEFLLMDEPFSHLDDDNTQIALDLINEISNERNAGYVITSLGSNNKQEFNRTLSI